MTQHSHSETEPRTYEQELALTEELIAQGDHGHAVHHCVSALCLGAGRTEWQPLLRRLMAEPAVVAKLEADNYFGAYAARAFHLYDTGDRDDALSIIAQVHATMPHLGFERWLLAWLDETAAIAPRLLVTVLSTIAGVGIGRMRLLPSEAALAEAMAPLARLAVRQYPGEVSVAVMASAVLRRAGLYDDAARAVDGVTGDDGREAVSVARALALRGARRFDAALAAFDAAMAASGDPVFHMERFRVLADAGRWRDALADWNRFRETNQPSDENRLEHAVVVRAAVLEAPPPELPPLDLVRRRALGHGRLWPMLDATANALRRYAEQRRATSPVAAGTATRGDAMTVSLRGAEGPSNRLCLALMFHGEPDPRRSAYSMDDGSLARLTGLLADAVLWRREGDVFVQALPPPAAPVSDWIERVALHEPDGVAPESVFESTPDFLDLWALATAIPPPAATAQDWLAATVFPRVPLCRACAAPEWMYRWQVVALIGLVHSEPGWGATAKRTALRSLLSGAPDWTLAAATRVAAELALREPSALVELRQLLIDRAALWRGDPNGALTSTLYDALEMLPLVPKASRDKLREVLEADETDDIDEADEVDEAPEKPARRWWKFWAN
jgi:hypothetical protein